MGVLLLLLESKVNESSHQAKMFDIGFESAIGLSASSLGNVGPAIGDFGPVNNFYEMPTIGKWWCSFLMLIGRLELFTVLILMTPFFWRNR